MAFPRFSGQALHDLRVRRGLTITQFAAAIGRSASIVVSYESGRNGPSVDALSAMAIVLGVSIDDLFEPADDLVAA